MALLIDHQSINVPAGSRDFGPVTIPDGLTRVTLKLARRTTATPTLWAAGVTVDLKSWCSLDGGMTWIQWGGFGGVGGIHIKRDSAESVESTGGGSLPIGSSRRIKLTLTVSGGTLVSLLTVEVV